MSNEGREVNNIPPEKLLAALCQLLHDKNIIKLREIVEMLDQMEKEHEHDE